MSDLKRVTAEELEEIVEKGWMVYILFTVGDCPTCQDTIAVFNDLEGKVNGIFCEVDARSEHGLCEQYSVAVVPTVVVVKNEDVVGHMVWPAISIEKILSFDD